jgi:integrase
LVRYQRLGGIFAPVFQLLLLRGQRREEVAALRWDEVDLEKAVWTTPAERCKNGKPHHLDLPPQAFSILCSLHEERLADRDLVFATRA